MAESYVMTGLVGVISYVAGVAITNYYQKWMEQDNGVYRDLSKSSTEQYKQNTVDKRNRRSRAMPHKPQDLQNANLVKGHNFFTRTKDDDAKREKRNASYRNKMGL
jgi:hypothetical protein